MTGTLVSLSPLRGSDQRQLPQLLLQKSPVLVAHGLLDQEQPHTDAGREGEGLAALVRSCRESTLPRPQPRLAWLVHTPAHSGAQQKEKPVICERRVCLSLRKLHLEKGR